MEIEVKIKENKELIINPLFNGLSDESKISKQLLEYFKKKYCEEVAIVSLLKCCAISSSQLSDKLHLFVIAPQGQFKSQEDKEITELFPKKMIHNLGSDMTIHRIKEKFKTGIPETCLIINDYTLLMHTKEKRTRLRLEGALAEIMSEGKYTYGDFKEEFTLTGNPSMIINMSFEAFNMNKSRMSESTFLDRLMQISYSVPPEVQHNIFLNKPMRLPLKFEYPKFKNVRFKKQELGKYRNYIAKIGMEYACKSLQSYNRMWDLLESLIKSHAYLNNRKFINEDDLILINNIKDFIGNIYSKEGEIIKTWVMWKQDGKDYTKSFLAEYFHRNTEYINKLIFKAKLRGLLSEEWSH